MLDCFPNVHCRCTIYLQWLLHMLIHTYICDGNEQMCLWPMQLKMNGHVKKRAGLFPYDDGIHKNRSLHSKLSVYRCFQLQNTSLLKHIPTATTCLTYYYGFFPNTVLTLKYKFILALAGCGYVSVWVSVGGHCCAAVEFTQ